jgi:hypothetical protein
MAAASKIVQAAIEVLAKKSGGALPDTTVPPKTLPTDEASRMARAREMGFTEDAYRGVGEGEHLEQMTHAGNPLTPMDSP